MIRYLILSVIWIMLIQDVSAQKEDYFWIYGYDSNLFIEGHENYFFDFNIGSSPDSIRDLSPLWIRGNNSSICDADGNLLFYTNGCHIVDRNHDIMPNGSGINEGGNFLEFFRQDTCSNYPGRQDVIILQDPAYESGYYLVHKRIEFEFNGPEGEIFNDKLLYSYVDMTINNGLGDVTEKNIIISNSVRLLGDYLTAIKHENGQDWWVIQPNEEDEILIFLLDDSGISLINKKDVEVSFNAFTSASGTAKFSPDGRKYVFYNSYQELLLYDFDRSTGLLTNCQKLEIVNAPKNIARFSSIEWSHNSRFLYISSQDVLYQLDANESNLEDGLVLIDTWNGIRDPFNTTFNLMASAPDCKIYMCSGSSTNTYHVINNPNEEGTACDFVQQGIRLPFVSATATMPNFPRFRVDEDDKCDPTITSIFGDDIYYRRDLSVYPNPVRNVLTVEIPEGRKGQLVVLDMQGQLVSDDKCRDLDCRGSIQVDMSGLAVGTYSVEFIPDNPDPDGYRDYREEKLVYTSLVVKVE